MRAAKHAMLIEIDMHSWHNCLQISMLHR